MKPLAILLLSCLVWGAAVRAAEPNDSTQNTNDALQAQLDAARERLESAAREVAELSARLGTQSADFPFIATGVPRASLGLQLDPHSGTEGARVLEVSPGGPAAEAGVREGDVITALNGTAVTGAQSARKLVERMRQVAPDSTVTLRILRAGKQHELRVTTRRAFAADFAGPVIAAIPGARTFLPPLPDLRYVRALSDTLEGMELVTMTSGLGQYFGTDKGVLVVRASRDERFQLRDGDVIVSIDGREPRSGGHATRILRSYQPGERVTLKIMRHNKPMTLTVAMPGAAGAAAGPADDE